MKPHKHSELIKAWAEGAKIEYHLRDNEWHDADPPEWLDNVDYRIKPEPKIKQAHDKKWMYIYNDPVEGKTWISPSRTNYLATSSYYLGKVLVYK